MSPRHLRLTTLLLLTLFSPLLASAAPADDARQTLDRALAYLKAQQQPDGSWQRSPREPLAVTALVLHAFALDEKTGPTADFVAKGYDYLLAQQKPDGGIYQGMLQNYNTAICLSALAAARNPKYRPAIDKAVAYLKSTQLTDAFASPDGRKITPDHPWHGGWGYGGANGGGRPDLSNTVVMLEALHDAGLPPTDPTFQRALTFVSRLQNNTETNKLPFASNDGGFVYEVAADGQHASSAAGQYTEPDGTQRARSYGSMTYGALKSMVYAGLTRDDPRVKAALNWIRSNYTLTANPGMNAEDPAAAESGLYYYYQTFGKALSAWGQPTLTDANGNTHDWRTELVAELKQRQRPDGSFVGTSKWMENNPTLTTAFAALSLEQALHSLQSK